jgi:hypothetical protein
MKPRDGGERDGRQEAGLDILEMLANSNLGLGIGMARVNRTLEEATMEQRIEIRTGRWDVLGQVASCVSSGGGKTRRVWVFLRGRGGVIGGGFLEGDPAGRRRTGRLGVVHVRSGELSTM